MRVGEIAATAQQDAAGFPLRICFPTSAVRGYATMSDTLAPWIGGKEIALLHSALPVHSPFLPQSRLAVVPMARVIARLVVRLPLSETAREFQPTLNVAFRSPIGDSSKSYVACRIPTLPDLNRAALFIGSRCTRRGKRHSRN